MKQKRASGILWRNSYLQRSLGTRRTNRWQGKLNKTRLQVLEFYLLQHELHNNAYSNAFKTLPTPTLTFRRHEHSKANVLWQGTYWQSRQGQGFVYRGCGSNWLRSDLVNLLAPELLFLISAHPVYKTWIIQDRNKLALWNKLHFEEKETESIQHV